MGIGPRIRNIFPDVAGGTWKRSRFLHVSLVAAAIFLPAYAYFQSKVGVSLTDPQAAIGLGSAIDGTSSASGGRTSPLSASSTRRSVARSMRT